MVQEAGLAVGMQVEHEKHGRGRVTSLQGATGDHLHAPLKVFVEFESGEKHGYKASSLHKLRPATSRAVPSFHVWVHHAVDTHLAPFPFGEMLCEKLRSFGISAWPELEQGESANQADAHICIFLLSNGIFYDERSVALMRSAVELGKTCLLVNLPSARYASSQEKPHELPFPENAFNPTWAPYCPELMPAFAEICITWCAQTDPEPRQALCDRLTSVAPARHAGSLSTPTRVSWSSSGVSAHISSG